MDYRDIITLNYFDLDDIMEYARIMYEPFIYINNFRITISNNYPVIAYFHNGKTKIELLMMTENQ